ncbi:DUF58 domain-containing protein [Enemella evansiae]|uniref:DUF58 domain-containing protein n=1 Tax=Enemella evansiae TaxID=2016499 RepID=A0A255GPE0_9ACTN|nr:DUF58 domain-containing protein [Enemella evansiae]OYN96977.1 DUF58 domain-containing protein [Enemella evansiae]OYO06181.1 DUF58 domain-containing protein [Enemella evansiae]OYO17679.1 DUF58 domain-containing protein [Enemella evansiae]PFG68911.1 uncharacterized protein (DUF58 family) [Propionibacteriaceae bacterium ES.041]
MWGRLIRLGRRTGLTAAGGWLLLAVLLLGLSGLLLGWLEFRLAAVAGAVLLLVAVLFSLGRQAYAIRLDLAGNRVVVGEPAQGRLLVGNTSSGRILPSRIDLPVGPRTASLGVPSLAGRATHTEVFTLPTERRARLVVGPARSVRADPFSLFARTVTWTGSQELFVHPRTVRLAGRRGGFVRDLEGHSTDELATSDVSFHALRDYVSGDDRRHVHWRSSARAQKLLVRQFTETRRSVVAVGLDLAVGSWGAADEFDGVDEFEDGVSVIASLGLEALAEENPLVAVAGEDELAAATRTSLLDALSGVAPTSAERVPTTSVERARNERVPLTSAERARNERVEATRGAGVADLARRVLRAAPGASVVWLVTGSAVDPTDLRRAAAVFGPDVRVLGVRLAPLEPLLVRTAGRVTTINLPGLGQLGAALRRAVAQ